MYNRNMNCEDNRITPRQLQLLNNLRRLWTEHVMWTRSFIVSTAFSLPDLDYVTHRLLRNPEDFAEMLRPFYGAERAKIFENLLTEHLEIGAQLVNAAKAGDTKTADEVRRQWYDNADDIAEFLSEINPYWSRLAWQTMLYDHLKMTENEAGQILTGQYEASIDQYDAIQREALEMGDYMANGMIKQFRI